MVAMVFRRMASSTTPSKLGDSPLVHFPSSPLDPAGALPALGTPPESTGGGDKVLTIRPVFYITMRTRQSLIVVPQLPVFFCIIFVSDNNLPTTGKV